MKRARLLRAGLGAAAVAALALLLACGKDKGTNNSGGGEKPIRVEVTVSINLESAVLPPGVDVEAVTPFESVGLDSAGSGRINLNSGYFQLVQALTGDTVPLLLAIASPPNAGSAVVLSQHSTAVSLIYLAPFICQADTVAARQVLSWIDELPETSQLTSLIGWRIAANPSYLLADDQPLIDLVKSAQEKILGQIGGVVGVKAGKVSAASVITPQGEQDGISLTELAASGNVERFKATNQRRRWLIADLPDGVRHIPSRGGITNISRYLAPPSVEFGFDVDSHGETPVQFWGPGLKDLGALWPTFDPTGRSELLSATTLTLLGDGLAPILSTILGVGPIPDNLLLDLGNCLLNDPGFAGGTLADFEGVVHGEPWHWGALALRTTNSVAKCLISNPQWVVDVLEYFGNSAVSIILRGVIVPLKVVKLAVTAVDLGILLHDVVESRPLTVFTLSAKGDQTPPATVSDLRVGQVGPTSLRLYWTAPGDNGSEGQASAYDVCRSTSPITGDNWASATALEGEPLPAPAGRPESLLVPGLTGSTTYYFALKTADEVPNWSDLSNLATTQTASNPQANWSKYYLWPTSDLRGTDAVPTPDSGYLAAGTLSWDGSTYLVKTDGAGNTVWEKHLDGLGVSSLAMRPDGGFFMGGGIPNYEYSSPPHYAFIARAEPSGQLDVVQGLWSGDAGSAVVALASASDGGCYALGSHSGADLFVAKINALGQVSWNVLVGGAQTETPGGIAATSDGGCIVTGSTESFIPPGYIGNKNLYLVKFSASGAREWERAYVNYGVGRDEEGEGVLSLPDGTYIVAGWDNSSFVDDEYGLHATLWKVGSNGDLVWRKAIGRLNAYAQGVASAPDGRLVLAGGGEGYNLALIEATADGELITDVYGFSSPSTRIRSTLDGGFVVAGSAYSYARYYWSMNVRKFDLAWLEGFGAP
jgi:hypothetical protein